MKWKYLLVIALAVCLIASIANAQQNDATNEETRKHKGLYLGAGIGFDHGGIGFKAAFEPIKHVALFGGVGYNLAGIAGNGGITFNLMPDKIITPTLTAMYGYNAVLQIKTTQSSGTTLKQSAMYDGLTLGAGMDMKFGRRPQKVSFALLIPLRNAAFFDEYNYLKGIGYEFSPDVVPVGFSTGWSINLSGRKQKAKTL